MTEPSDSLFTVLLHRRPGCTYVVASGELDLVSAGTIEREIRLLLSAGCGVVAIDLRELGFIDSSGIHELLRCRDAALASGARLHLLVAPGPVSRALDVCRVRSRFDERPPAAA